MRGGGGGRGVEVTGIGFCRVRAFFDDWFCVSAVTTRHDTRAIVQERDEAYRASVLLLLDTLLSSSLLSRCFVLVSRTRTAWEWRWGVSPWVKTSTKSAAATSGRRKLAICGNRSGRNQRQERPIRIGT